MIRRAATSLLLASALLMSITASATVVASGAYNPWLEADRTAQTPSPTRTGDGLIKPVLESAERPAGMSIRTWQRMQGRLQKTSTHGLYVHSVRYTYTASGFLAEVDDPQSGTIYWQANQVNIHGQVTVEKLGNDVVTSREYHPVTGALLTVVSGQGNANVQQLAFQWDMAGNLERRVDQIAGHDESFLYDNLYRLKKSSFLPTATGAGSPLVTNYHYHELGQFQSRDDAGVYGYGSPGNPHRVHSLARASGQGTTYFAYDANGNVVTQSSAAGGGGTLERSFTFGTSNRLTKIQLASGAYTRFDYGPTGARYRQTKQVGTRTETTTYIGGLYEKLVEDDNGAISVSHRLYIRVGDKVIAEEVITDTSRETRYWHRDHLGSVTAITTQAYNGGAYGALGTQGFYGIYGYAAWGEARQADTAAANPYNWTDATIFPSGVYHRGFTGHEMLADFGLIHMNGRVYMPELGVFLSPDPFVQFPESTQNYNRYSYVGNNPLSYTDPSGHFLAFLKAALFAYNMFKSYEAGGFGGLVKGFLLSAASAGIANDIGGHFASVAAKGAVSATSIAVQKAIAHGVTQGLISVAGGGRLSDGFLGGAASSLTGPLLEKLGKGPGQAVIAAVVGGTVSKIGGGKFGTGAMSAAFVNLFNDQEHAGDSEAAESSHQSDEEGRVQVDTIVIGNVHIYRIRGLICGAGTPGCDESLADTAYGYVNRNDIPFTDDDLGSGPRGLIGNRIRHFENQAERLSVNITESPHLFYPGNVTHRVHFENGNLYYDVVGVGGGLFKHLNNALGVALFRPGVVRAVDTYGR